MGKYSFVDVEEWYPQFCYICGSETRRIILLSMVCPNCTAPITVKVCVNCARKLLHELTNVLQ